MTESRARDWLARRREAIRAGEPRDRWEHPPPELAAEVARIRGGQTSERPTLASTCDEVQIPDAIVTLYAAEAARVYAEGRRLSPAEARADLERMLPQARESVDGSWRHRRRADGVDITLQIRRQSRVAIVVGLTARPYFSR